MKTNSVNAAEQKTDGRQKVFAPKNVILAAAAVALVVLIAVYVPVFWTGRNISSVLVSTSTIGLLAVGVSFTLAGKGLDISLPAVMALSAVCGAKVMVNTQNLFVGILTMFAVAVLFGIVNGVACSVFKMYPFIVTMSTMILAQGANSVISKSVSVSGFPSEFVRIFNGSIGPVPVPIVVLILFTVVGYFLLNRSVFGRKIFAIGVNDKAAQICGIQVDKIKFLSYVAASLYAGLVAVILTARLKSASPLMASDNMNLDVLAAAVIGGVSMDGGTGNIIGVFGGALLINSLTTIMNLTGVGNFEAMVVKGLLVLAITYLDAARTRRK